MTRTALYRHFDVDGRLLYVGITCDLSGRDKAHSGASGWHPYVARSETEWFKSRRDAARAETKAILQERPLHNKMSSTEPDADSTASRVVQLRVAAGLSQQEFSKLIGVKRSRLSIWECGTQRLSLDGALILRKEFGVSLDWLFPAISEATQ